MEEHCPTCGASMKAYWHRLSPGLVTTLKKIYDRVVAKNENKVSKHELVLTHSEYGNFQKLRFHGMIARYKVRKSWDRATWLITRRGGQFLRGEIRVPERVRTFRNAVTGHAEELVNIKDVLGTEPYFDQKFSFEFVDLFDDGDYTPGIPVKKRKGKAKGPKCPDCATPMKKISRSQMNPEGTAYYLNWFYYCPNCKHEEAYGA